jgi:hypothetical protein
MPGRTRKLALGFIVMSLMLCEGRAQQGPADCKQTDSSTIAPDGTAYVTRIVPVPTTISPEAQKVLARVQSGAAVPQTLEQRRTGTDKWQAGAGEASKKLYPANVTAEPPSFPTPCLRVSVAALSQVTDRGPHPGYLLMSSFASRRFSSGWRNGFVASGAPLIACVISLAAVGKSPVFDEIRASARWLIQ